MRSLVRPEHTKSHDVTLSRKMLAALDENEGRVVLVAVFVSVVGCRAQGRVYMELRRVRWAPSYIWP